MMMTDDDYDALIGRWHEMAVEDRHVLKQSFGAEAVALLKAVMLHAVGLEDVLVPADADQFADMVLALRNVERTWSKHLGTAIIRAEDAAEAGKAGDAVAVLSAFIVACPWRSFREIADAQRDEYL